jgi:hypothetical protein
MFTPLGEALWRMCGGGQSRGRQTPLIPTPAACNAALPCPLRSCIPGPLGAEAGLVYGQGLLLVLRTLLTDYVSRLEGQAGRWIIQQDFAVLSKVLAMFVAVSGSGSGGSWGGLWGLEWVRGCDRHAGGQCPLAEWAARRACHVVGRSCCNRQALLQRAPLDAVAAAAACCRCLCPRRL